MKELKKFTKNLTDNKVRKRELLLNIISISLLLKSVIRNSKIAFLYMTHRIKRIKLIYWFDCRVFSQKNLKEYHSKIEIKFLKSYHRLLLAFSKKIGLDICENLTPNLNYFLIEFRVKRDCFLVKEEIKLLKFSRLTSYFLQLNNIRKLERSNFFSKISL